MYMSASGQHTEHRSCDEQHDQSPIGNELVDLVARIAAMGGLAEAQLAYAIDALSSRDAEAADYVVSNDVAIDDAETDINARALKMLTRYAPVAADLREIVAALKISANVERIGDYSVSIAKRSVIVSGLPQVPAVGGVIELGRLVRQHLQNAFDAYAERSVNKADAVWHGDREIDALHSSVFQDLLSNMLVDSDQVLTCTHLMFVIKNFERIGDHAASIAETIQFLVAGVPSTRKYRSGSEEFNVTPDAFETDIAVIAEKIIKPTPQDNAGESR